MSFGNFLLFGIFALLFYCVFFGRKFFNQTLEYREARTYEIKRRLQVEAKADEAYKKAIEMELDDRRKIGMELRASRERHERQVKYVIQDIFEKWQ